MPEAAGWIRLRGARTHNLRNVDADLPRACLTVITGPSGSGKSSLAFDTLHAEGQRRYLETLRAGTRALFAQLPRPDVDSLEGLPPTVCISQRTTAPRPRSTLATVTEIHDHLRLLWARLGTPHCWQCGNPIRKHTVADIVRATFTRGEGRKVFLLAPLVQDEPGGHREAFQQIRQGGYLRARVDDVLQEIRDIPQINPRVNHTIELVVDRLVVRAGLEDRFTESITTAAKLGAGRVLITDLDDGDWRDELFSTVFACPRCRIALPDPEPRRFSFNNPYGACPTCTGYGQVLDFDPEAASEEDDDKPERVRDALAAFVPCPECGGARLNREARSVRFADKGLHEVTALTVTDARSWFELIPKDELHDTAVTRARDVLLGEIATRLRFLDAVGLGYLTLDRPAPTLSGGELQRARLATYLGGGLRGVCYILDEPTMGLHPRDTDRLLHALRDLQSRGNSVVVVEHDEAVIRAADWLIDIGPGAGRDGGQLLAAGPTAEVLANPQSVTGKWLLRRPHAPREAGEFQAERESSAGDQALSSRGARGLRIRGARHHNLKNIDVAFPLGRLIAVSGVSGSGKSSLVRDILAHAARRRLGLQAPPPGAHDAVEGLEHIDKVIEVNQQPIGRSSRSCPATYTGLFDDLRQVFAATRAAKARGAKANRFSFNTRGGRCEECQGQGELKPDAHWLPELRVPCPACQGRRFNPATLAILYRGKSIADVLDMTVAEAAAFFANLPALQRALQPLAEVGLGYLTLGQPANTLSGGEAQRVKLATELARTATGRTLYLLDEPTTGLHVSDVANLVRVLRQLVAAGNTVVVIEHHLDVIAAADWVIDLGPEAGDGGGRLVCAGPPDELTTSADSVTGLFLRAGNRAGTAPRTVA
jgi:excinuclease ABC subunit A